jgi:AraC-like DNA-binding protein
MLMEPGEVHANTRMTPLASFRVLFVDPKEMKRAADELSLPAAVPHFRLAQVYDRGLFAAFRALHDALEGPAAPLERDALFVTCMRLLLERYCESSRALPIRVDHPVVKRARDFIDEHASDSIRLADLTAASGSASRFQLMRAFTAIVGAPPHAYQIQVRVNRARALLARGAAPSDVAVELGFADQSHFTRHFRRIVGVAPGVYARSARIPPLISLGRR